MEKRISPNRMELMRLKERLKVATRGHKLLKDKRDGLMRVFVTRIENAVRLRKRVDELLTDANTAMAKAASVTGQKVIGEALLLNAEPLKVKIEELTIMALSMPSFEINYNVNNLQNAKYPYGLATTTAELDEAIELLRKAFPALLELATAEKEIQMLAREIEVTRRRVNSLEHFMIPEMQEQIKRITMRLEENNRDNVTRLMKVKEQIIADNLERSAKYNNERIRKFKNEIFTDPE